MATDVGISFARLRFSPRSTGIIGVKQFATRQQCHSKDGPAWLWGQDELSAHTEGDCCRHDGETSKALGPVRAVRACATLLRRRPENPGSYQSNDGPRGPSACPQQREEGDDRFKP